MVAAALVALASEEEDAGEPQPLEVLEVPDAGFDAGVRVERELQTVVAGTSEERTAGSVHTLTSAKLKRFGLDDPHAVLQSVPGVYVRGEDGYGLRPNIGLRGANADRSKKVTLMEDGVLFGPAPYSAPAAYYFPLIARMESVRVVKGPSAVLYGPATVGGAIDFITRDVPSYTTGGLDLAGGMYGYGKLHGWFGSSNDTTGFLLEALHVRSSGFKQLDRGGDTGFHRTEVMAKARHRMTLGGAKHTFDVKLTFSAEESNETYLGLSDADFAARPLRRYVASALDHMSNHREAAVLSHRVELGPVTLVTSAYAHLYHRIWQRFDHLRGSMPGPVLASPTTPLNAVYYGVLNGTNDSASPEEQLIVATNDRQFVSSGVQSVLRASFDTWKLTHSVEVQLRYHFDRADRHHTGDTFEMRSGALSFAGLPVEQLLDNVEETHAFALSALDAVRIGPVTVTPGVRVELMRSRSNDRLVGEVTPGASNALLPGLGAHWAILPQLGVFAGAYRGFSPPAPGQVVPPEYSVNYEAGARWSRRGERIEAVGFFNDYSNLTDICTQSAGCSANDLDRQFSAGKAHIWGIEAYAEKTLSLPKGFVVPMSLAYTYTGTRLLESFKSADPQLGDVTAGDELPYVPVHQLHANLGVEVSGVSLHAQVNFIDRMREQAGQGEYVKGLTTDPVFTLDVRAAWRPLDWAQLYLDVHNATDSHAIVARRPFGARPNAPRTFSGGLKLTY